jgi:hypothetical protein
MAFGNAKPVEKTLPAFPLATMARAPAGALTAEDEMMSQ